MKAPRHGTRSERSSTLSVEIGDVPTIREWDVRSMASTLKSGSNDSYQTLDSESRRSSSTPKQSSNQEIIFGTLEKRGYWNTAWKTRYFVLTQRGELAYFNNQYEAESGARRRGTVAVALPQGTPASVCRALETRVRGAAPVDRDGRFLIEMDVRTVSSGMLFSSYSTRTYVLSAPSAITRARWVAALTNAASAWRDTDGCQSKAVVVRPQSRPASASPGIREQGMWEQGAGGDGQGAHPFRYHEASRQSSFSSVPPSPRACHNALGHSSSGRDIPAANSCQPHTPPLRPCASRACPRPSPRRGSRPLWGPGGGPT
mmetsp:Transcript_69190/g.184394  ORF Transcript_69190/g.184394 Transcript_69190/m.184394 type:complete len:316 (+) Transcript_69190:161-1108(+)